VQEEPLAFDYLPSRPKLTRPGALLDTGDAMPRTDFYRPNPLDSDIIMDATARLLAPRKVALTPTFGARPAEEEAPAKSARKKKKKKAAPQAAPAPVKEVKAPEPPPAEPAKKKKKKKKKGAKPASVQETPAVKQEPTPKKPAPSQKAAAPKAAANKRKHSQADRRPEPRKSQIKDSTEQHSLMKPYYLDMGR